MYICFLLCELKPMGTKELMAIADTAIASAGTLVLMFSRDRFLKQAIGLYRSSMNWKELEDDGISRIVIMNPYSSLELTAG